jgi:mannose-6-phosphate isomerase
MNKYVMRLRPVCKDIIWGGDLLKNEYNKKCDSEKLAESWELTVRKDGMSVIDNGEYAGMTLGEYLGLSANEDGEYDFPLLVKYIDARDDLSVQVHPNKTELWYIVEASPDAHLVYGLKEDFDEDSFRKALADKTLYDLLNVVNVKAGEYYLLPSGQIHAICGGILIAEFQQNSNTTYRVWDYDRGREIHTEQAIETMKALKVNGDFSGMSESEYFKVEKFDFNDGVIANSDDFIHVMCISGCGKIGCAEVNKGDSCFIPADCGDIEVKGEMTLMLCHPRYPENK